MNIPSLDLLYSALKCTLWTYTEYSSYSSAVFLRDVSCFFASAVSAGVSPTVRIDNHHQLWLYCELPKREGRHEILDLPLFYGASVILFLQYRFNIAKK